MSGIVHYTAHDVLPGRAAVLAHQGIPEGRPVSATVEATLRAAQDLFLGLAAPVSILAEISKDEFARVYEGQGENETRTPVADVAGRADRLALFAVTIGPRVSDEIGARFGANDPAVGCMLDSVASIAADAGAERVCRDFGARFGEGVALGYSPGYCGWHVSGQGRLFEFLQPQRIGIALRESFLMEPLKSVSGVVAVGPAEAHRFDMDYPSCTVCRDRTCRARIDALKGA
jgi:hypothetical protein